MKKKIVKFVSYLVLINSLLVASPVWAITEMVTEVSDEMTETTDTVNAETEEDSSLDSKEATRENNDVEIAEEQTKTSTSLEETSDKESTSKEETAGTSNESTTETNEKSKTTKKIDVESDGNWYEIDRGAQNGFFETENGAQYGFRGMGVTGYNIDEGNKDTTNKGYMDFAASYNGTSYLTESGQKNGKNFRDKGITLYVNDVSVTGEKSSVAFDTTGITRWAYQQNKETHFYKNDVTSQLYATMVDPDWQLEYTLTVDVNESGNDAMYYWNIYNISEEDVTMAALQTSQIQEHSGTQRVIGDNGGGGFLYKYAKGDKDTWFTTRIMDENSQYYTDFNKYYLGNWSNMKTKNNFGTNFDKIGDQRKEGDSIDIFEGRGTWGQTIVTEGGYQLGTDKKTISPSESLSIGEKISFGTRATETEVRNRFSLAESDGWEMLTPGVSKDGYIQTRSGTEYGFRGMGVTGYEANVDTKYHEGNGYLDFAAASPDGVSYIYDDKSNHINHSIIPYLNGTQLNNSSHADFIDRGILGRYYQEIQTLQFFINREEAKLFGVMYTQDQITMTLTIDVDVQNDTADYLWEFINERNERIDIGILETVDTFIFHDNNDIIALGRNQGISLEEDDYQFIIQFADINGDWKTDFNKFYAGNYDKVKQTNMFGNNFDQAGLEANKDSQGTAYDGGKDTAYQVGTDLHYLNRNESVSVGSNVYFGLQRDLPELKASFIAKNESRDSGKYYLDEKDTLWMFSRLEDDYDLTIDWTLYLSFNDEKYEEVGVFKHDFEGISPWRFIDVNIDEEKLTNLNGQDDIHLVAEAPGSRKTNMLTQELQLITISGDPQVTAIPLGSDLLEEKRLDDLVKNLDIVHTTPSPLYDYSDKAPDTSKIGFVNSEIQIKDAVTPETNYGDITIPVTVYDEETTVYDIEKLLALDSRNTIRMSESTATEYLSNPSENSGLIINPANVTAWYMLDGTDISQNVTVASTDLKAQDGEYTATLNLEYNDETIQKEITVIVTDLGVTGFYSTPSEILFETTKIQSKDWSVPVASDPIIAIENTAKNDWSLLLYSSSFKDSDGNDAGYLLEGTSGNKGIYIDTGIANESTPDIYAFPVSDKLNLTIPTRSVLPDTTYTAEFNWVLVVADPTQ